MWELGAPPEENELAEAHASAWAKLTAVLCARGKLDEMRDVAGLIQLHTGGNDSKPLHKLLLRNQHFIFFSWTLTLRLNLSSAINTNLESKEKSLKDRTIREWARLKRTRDLFYPRGCSVWKSSGYGQGLFAALLAFNAREERKGQNLFWEFH